MGGQGRRITERIGGTMITKKQARTIVESVVEELWERKGWSRREQIMEVAEVLEVMLTPVIVLTKRR